MAIQVPKLEVDALRAVQRTEKIVDATEKPIDRIREFRSALTTAAVTSQIDLTAWGKCGESDRRLESIEVELASRGAGDPPRKARAS